MPWLDLDSTWLVLDEHSRARALTRTFARDRRFERARSPAGEASRDPLGGQMAVATRNSSREGIVRAFQASFASAICRAAEYRISQ